MRIDARISNARTNNVVAANLAVANDAVLAQLPSLGTMRRDVRRNRQVHQGLPEVPDRGNHLFEIPHPFDETTTGERFLHYDNNREARMLIFGTRRSFDYLANSDHWFMDGTFSTVPFQFSQLYTYILVIKFLCNYQASKSQHLITYLVMLRLKKDARLIFKRFRVMILNL